MQGIDFDEIPINREEISQSKLNIENKTLGLKLTISAA